MGGEVKSLGRVLVSGNSTGTGAGESNTLGVIQKGGHQFFRLSEAAGGEAGRGVAVTATQNLNYQDTVTKIQNQIVQSATSRSLLDRIRDPHNHTAKTQILQLVQLAARNDGKALEALKTIAHDDNARPLLTSALASAMGGAPWVAERNAKIAEGVLDMGTLDAGAVEIFGKLIARGNGGGSHNESGIRLVSCGSIAVKTHAQLQKHTALSSSTAPFWTGLTKLPPRQRCQFGKDFREHFGDNAITPQEDFIAAKPDASQREAWSIALRESPITFSRRVGEERQISSFSDLDKLQAQTSVFFDEGARNKEVRKVRTDLSAAASAGGNKAKQVLARSLELSKSIESDAESVRDDLPRVRHSIRWDYVGKWGLALPTDLKFLALELGDDQPRKGDVNAFAQERMLGVLEEAFKSLPYRNSRLPGCTTLAAFHRDVSAKGGQPSVAERLYGALQTLASYQPPAGAGIEQKDYQALLQISQRILESNPPPGYTPIISSS